MVTIIYSNLVPAIALAALLFLIKFNPLFDARQSRLFKLATVINLVLLFSISLDFLMMALRGDWEFAWIIRRVTSFLNFAASPVVPMLLYKIFVPGKSRLIFYLPLVFNCVLCFLSIFFQLVFFITPENNYDRGLFFLVPFACGCVYLILLIITSIRLRNTKRSECIFLLCAIGLLNFAMFLEVGLGFLFLTWDCAAVCLVLYYLLLNINNSVYDPLTGAFNRAMYHKRLSLLENSVPCCCAVVDVNHFKQINDTQGHKAGDQFLILLTRVLKSQLTKGTWLYRIGGDEFVVLSTSWDIRAMRERLGQALLETRKSGIDFAWGVAQYQPGHGSLEGALQTADKAMYEDKNKGQ